MDKNKIWESSDKSTGYIIYFDIKKAEPRETLIYVVVIISVFPQIGLVCQGILSHRSNSRPMGDINPKLVHLKV